MRHQTSSSTVSQAYTPLTLRSRGLPPASRMPRARPVSSSASRGPSPSGARPPAQTLGPGPHSVAFALVPEHLLRQRRRTPNAIRRSCKAWFGQRGVAASAELLGRAFLALTVQSPASFAAGVVCLGPAKPGALAPARHRFAPWRGRFAAASSSRVPLPCRSACAWPHGARCGQLGTALQRNSRRCSSQTCPAMALAHQTRCLTLRSWDCHRQALGPRGVVSSSRPSGQAAKAQPSQQTFGRKRRWPPFWERLFWFFALPFHARFGVHPGQAYGVCQAAWHGQYVFPLPCIHR